jgi:hypothetical protein
MDGWIDRRRIDGTGLDLDWTGGRGRDKRNSQMKTGQNRTEQEQEQSRNKNRAGTGTIDRSITNRSTRGKIDTRKGNTVRAVQFWIVLQTESNKR